MGVAAGSALAMAAMSLRLFRNRRNKDSQVVRARDGNPIHLKDYFLPNSRNVIVIGQGEILESLLAYFGKDPEEIDDFCNSSKLEETLDERDLNDSMLGEAINQTRMEIRENCFLWRIPRSTVEDVFKSIVDDRTTGPLDLSLDAADAIISVSTELSPVDMALLVKPPTMSTTHTPTMLKTLVVRDVKNQKGYVRLETDLKTKLSRVLKLDKGESGKLKPNWLGLLGTDLECPGGAALKSLVAPTVHAEKKCALSE